MQSRSQVVNDNVFSVGFACCDPMSLTATSVVLSIVRPKQRDAPTMLWMIVIPSFSKIGKSSSSNACCVFLTTFDVRSWERAVLI